MRFINNLILTAALILAAANGPAAWAVRSVAQPQASVNTVLANTPVTVTVTAQVSVDANLNGHSITLVRFSPANQVIWSVPMYDDGATGGDTRAGDGVYTAQINLNESVAGLVILKATAGFKHTVARVKSTALTIPVSAASTDAQINQFIAIETNGTAKLATLHGQNDANAIQDTLTYLGQQAGVSSEGVSSDGMTLWFITSSGMEGDILNNPVGTKGALKQSKAGLSPRNRIAANAAQSRVVIGSVTAPQRTGSSAALCIAPFFDSFAPSDETDYIANKLQTTCSAAPLVVKNAGGDVNAFKNMSKYGVVSISSHGAVSAGGQVVILTREQATYTSTIAHLGDWLTGRIINVSGYWAITPKFVTAYAGTGYPQSLIYVSACNSSNNSTMKDAFINSGAKTYFGFSKVVNSGFSYQKGIALFNTLADETLAETARTTQVAFNNTGNKTDPNAPFAVFQMFGATDLILLLDLVSNGGFETGDLTGWTADTDFGYDEATTENVSAGIFAARIGRWDQPYTFFGGLNGPPVAGVEPGGIDYIYQDVTLPADATVLPYSFNYDVVSFDGADYDWFDAEVVDPATGAILEHPVANVGGIVDGSPANWGLFTDSGWQHVTLDLTAYKGTTVRLLFTVTQDGFGDQTAAYVDQVSLKCTP